MAITDPCPACLANALAVELRSDYLSEHHRAALALARELEHTCRVVPLVTFTG